MIAKTAKAEPGRTSKRSPREPQRMDIGLTVRFKFGEEVEDTVTVMDNRQVPMVDSVFKNRDLILKGFLGMLIKTGLSSPKVTRELFPAMRLLNRRRKTT